MLGPAGSPQKAWYPAPGHGSICLVDVELAQTYSRSRRLRARCRFAGAGRVRCHRARLGCRSTPRSGQSTPGRIQCQHELDRTRPNSSDSRPKSGARTCGRRPPAPESDHHARRGRRCHGHRAGARERDRTRGLGYHQQLQLSESPSARVWLFCARLWALGARLFGRGYAEVGHVQRLVRPASWTELACGS